MTIEVLKRAAGGRAAEMVDDGMVVGLGSGSTSREATLAIGRRLRDGSLRDIVAVPTSEDTARLAKVEGIPLTTLDEQLHVDLTIDGADEVDPRMNVIKGLGGCLLREKVVASASRREVIIVDDSKLVDVLGTKSPVPVEIIRFGRRQAEAALRRTGAETTLRSRGGDPVVTDEGNYIIDCRYAAIESPYELASALKAIPGVVEHGLFLGMVHVVIVASALGLQILEG